MGLDETMWGFARRFTITHVVTYTVVGIAFLWLMPYEEFFLKDTGVSWRPLDSPIVQAAPLLQFIRGAFLSVVIYPFRGVIIKSPRGWLKLFILIWGLTLVGAVNAGGGSIEGLIYTAEPLESHLVGIPEVTVQMALFSWLFVRWENRKANATPSGNM